MTHLIASVTSTDAARLATVTLDVTRLMAGGYAATTILTDVQGRRTGHQLALDVSQLRVLGTALVAEADRRAAELARLAEDDRLAAVGGAVLAGLQDGDTPTDDNRLSWCGCARCARERQARKDAAATRANGQHPEIAALATAAEGYLDEINLTTRALHREPASWGRLGAALTDRCAPDRRAPDRSRRTEVEDRRAALAPADRPRGWSESALRVLIADVLVARTGSLAGAAGWRVADQGSLHGSLQDVQNRAASQILQNQVARQNAAGAEL